MGYTLQSVMLFTDDIRVRPYESTEPGLIGRPVSIHEFAQGQPVSLEREVSTGELLVKGAHGRFMFGPEV